MMTSYFEYIVTSLDMHSIDLEDFKFGGTNITAFRLVDPHNPEVVEVRSYAFSKSGRAGMTALFQVVRSWILGEKRFPSRVSANPVPFIKAETALIYDAVYVFASALDSLDQSQEVTVDPLHCEVRELRLLVTC